MNTRPAGRFLDRFDDALDRVRESLLGAIGQVGSEPAVPVFFRADDIGVLSANFLRLLRLFGEYQLPLSLAVVPSWLSRTRWRALGEKIDTRSPLWCWHQHGWTHTNHEPAGKKAEFGPARSAAALRSDLVRGRERLETIIGSAFYPVFTPPWNRCSTHTTDILAEMGFLAVSRSRGEQRQPAALPDHYVNVDLHTRKERDGATALDNLCGEIYEAAAERRISFMIHHQLMDEHQFRLLEALLELTASNSRLEGRSFAAPG